MADADTSVAARVPGAPVEPRDQVAKRDPDALAGQIERTREELARTIDAIADRVNPVRAARRAVTRARQEASRIDPKLAAAGAAVLVVGVAAILLWRRRR